MTDQFSGITVFLEVANAGNPSVQTCACAAAPSMAGQTQIWTFTPLPPLLNFGRLFISTF